MTKQRLFQTIKLNTKRGAKSRGNYLRTIFAHDDEKLELFNMLKNRSIHDFGVNLSKDDKIITLSTCNGKDFRFVLHAVLQKDA